MKLIKTIGIGLAATTLSAGLATPANGQVSSTLPTTVNEQPTTPEGIELMRRIVRRNMLEQRKCIQQDLDQARGKEITLTDGEGGEYTYDEALAMVVGQRMARAEGRLEFNQDGEEVTIEGADIVFLNDEKDFGIVPEKSELVHRFTFKNNGTEILVIEKVNTGCGCTVAKLPKTEFAPGEIGHIDITYKPKGPGSQKRSIQVLTNDAELRITTLLLKVEVIPIVAARPGTVQLGNVPLGEMREVVIEVVSRDAGMKILGANVNGPEFSVEVVKNAKPQGLIDPQLPGYGQVRVKLLGNAEVGRLLRRLSIDVLASDAQNKPQQNRAVNVSVFAMVKGHLSVEPPFLRVKPLQADEAFSRETILFHDKGDEFRILDAKITNSNIDAEVEFEPVEHDGKPGYRIKISGRAGRVAARFRGKILVTTDVERQRIVEIEFSGLVRAARAQR